MKREKLEERVLIPKKLKLEILQKSKGRCCHCGKKLALGSTFTLEHIIPLSRGGSYDNDNLVALCDDCNKKKGNKVINPNSYYKYLDKAYMDSVLDMYNKYLVDFDWFKEDYIFQEDKFSVSVPILIKKGKDMVKKGFNSKGLPKKSLFMDVQYDVELCKTNKDREDVYNFLCDYIKSTEDNERVYNTRSSTLESEINKLSNLKSFGVIEINDEIKNYLIWSWAFKGTNYKITKSSSKEIFALVRCDFINAEKGTMSALNVNESLWTLSLEIMVNPKVKNTFANKSALTGVIMFLLGYTKLNLREEYFTYPLLLSYSANNELLDSVIGDLVGKNKYIEASRHSLYKLKNYLFFRCNDYTKKHINSKDSSGLSDEEVLRIGLANYIKYCKENDIGKIRRLYDEGSI